MTGEQEIRQAFVVLVFKWTEMNQKKSLCKQGKPCFYFKVNHWCSFCSNHHVLNSLLPLGAPWEAEAESGLGLSWCLQADRDNVLNGALFFPRSRHLAVPGNPKGLVVCPLL